MTRLCKPMEFLPERDDSRALGSPPTEPLEPQVYLIAYERRPQGLVVTREVSIASNRTVHGPLLPSQEIAVPDSDKVCGVIIAGVPLWSGR